MELEHSFTVPVPADQAWDVLLDVERVAPCMPGATLDSVDGDEIKGRIKVKVGPISMTYAGTARFTERNRDAGVVTLEAAGKETRGSGTASATVRSELRSLDGQTEVTVHTTLNVTGRPAQFGRGVMADVSGKLIGIFANNLAEMLAAGNDPAPEPAVPEPAVQAAAHDGLVPPAAPVSTAPASVPAPAEDSLNLLKVAGLPVLKRIAAPAGALLAVLAASLFWRRRRRR
jgi:carbon monoxide dehydrogenase subunit G